MAKNGVFSLIRGLFGFNNSTFVAYRNVNLLRFMYHLAVKIRLKTTL